MKYKNVIGKNFGAAAATYDQYSSLQRHCAEKLLRQVAGGEFERILDLGCGTGYYTQLLAREYPAARITALDLAAPMIAVARHNLRGARVEFIIADAEEVELSERFDLITANATLHWFGDPAKTLRKYAGLLTEKGVITFSTFGSQTFRELNTVLAEFYEENFSLCAANFIDREKITGILQSYFGEVASGEEVFTEEYTTLRELLRQIKFSGTRGAGLNEGKTWTPRTLANIETLYREKYGAITATYQVNYFRASNAG